MRITGLTLLRGVLGFEPLRSLQPSEQCFPMVVPVLVYFNNTQYFTPQFSFVNNIPTAHLQISFSLA